MAGTNLSFSKVVATPTPTAWSQAYSAGSLFAAISLKNETPSADNNLNTLGKDVISTLESEFFTLETKDLESIKKAIETTTAKINEGITLSFVICFLNENILYLYASGSGKALLKRGEKIGTVIDSEDSREIKSASGYVQDNDYIILQTKPFIQIISSANIASALDKEKVEEISEEIAPHVHDKEEGGASAVILSYKEDTSGVQAPVEETKEEETLGGAAAVGAGAGATAAAAAAISADAPVSDNESVENSESATEETKVEDEMKEDETNDEIEKMEQELNKSAEEEKAEESKEEPIGNEPQKEKDQAEKTESTTAAPFPDAAGPSRRRGPKFGFGRLKRIPRRLIALIGVILIILIIVAAIYFLFVRGGSSDGDFDAIYREAREKYEEGLSLKELNESLAEENFREAQLILSQNQNTFPEGSSEDDQIEELLNQVNQQLGESSISDGDTTTATEVDISESKLLTLAIENDTNYLTQNDDFILFITDEGVVRVDKGNDEEETVVETDWTDAGGIGIFGSNIYVLDREDNILKFVPAEDEYSRTDYLTGDVPDLTNSTSMAIDGSIYVLDSDGSITKFTRGTEDDFSTSGLSTPLSNPSQIWTTEDLGNIYILDNGNSRIVVLNSAGDFVKAYTADIIKNATAFDVQEEENQIFVLSDNKIYKINL